MTQKRVLIAAGGTGGHIIPAQAVGDELAQAGHTVAFIGHGLHENAFFDRARFSFCHVESSPLSVNIPRFAFHLIKGFGQARSYFTSFAPDLVIGFGSYHTIPPLAVAVLRGIPFVLFSADAHPGRVIRLFSARAHLTTWYFQEAKKRLYGRSCPVQFPLRAHFRSLPVRAEACKRYGLPVDLPILLVFGGSLGADVFNKILPKALQRLSFKIRVIHICGKKGPLDELQKSYRNLGIEAKVLPYEEHMECAYQAADVVVARSGASTIAEIRRCNKKALYIPYPYAVDDHQLKNAQAACEWGNAKVLPQLLASPDEIANCLETLFSAPTLASVDYANRPSLVQVLKEKDVL